MTNEEKLKMRPRFMLLASLLALTLSACPKPQPPAAAPPTRQLRIFAIELREKINTCRALDPQVARETLVFEDWGEQALMHLGAERVFPLQVKGAAKAQKLTGDFVESDHTTVSGHHIVCKRLTKIELDIKDIEISGTYERQRHQECVMDAKPCTTIWDLSGKLLQ